MEGYSTIKTYKTFVSMGEKQKLYFMRMKGAKGGGKNIFMDWLKN